MKKRTLLFLTFLVFLFSIFIASALEIEKEDSYISVFPNEIVCFEREIKIDKPAYMLFSSDKEAVKIESIESKGKNIKINSVVKDELEEVANKEDNFNDLAFVSSAGTYLIEYCYQMPDFETLRELKTGKFSYCVFEVTGISDKYVSDCENSIWWDFNYGYRQKVIAYSNQSNSNVSKCMEIEYDSHMAIDFTDITWTRQNATNVSDEKEEAWYLQVKDDEVDAIYCVNVYTDCTGLSVCNETHYFYYDIEIDNSGKSCIGCINWTVESELINTSYEYDDGTRDSYHNLPSGRRYFLNEFNSVNYDNVTRAELCIYADNSNGANNITIIDYNKNDVWNWTINETTGYEWVCKDFNLTVVNDTTEYFGFRCEDCCEENDLLLGADTSTFQNKSYTSQNTTPERWEFTVDNNMIRLNITNNVTTSADSPISLWRFDEGGGTVAIDSCGYNNGTISGASYTTGNYSYGLDFDGINDVVTIPDNATLSAISPLSLYFMIKDDGSSGNVRFFTKYSAVTGYEWDAFGNDGTTLMAITIIDNSAVKWIEQRDTNADWFDGEWHQVVMTWDGGTTDGGLHIYVDTIEVGDSNTGSGSFTGIDDTTTVVEIGGNANLNNWFNGTMDDVAIFDRVLTVPQIQSLYTRGVVCGGSTFTINETSYKSDDGSREDYSNMSILNHIAVKFTGIDLEDIKFAELCIFGDSGSKNTNLKIVDYNKDNLANLVVLASNGVYDWRCASLTTSDINATDKYLGFKCINCNCKNSFRLGLDTTTPQLHSYDSLNQVDGDWILDLITNHMIRLNITNNLSYALPNITYIISSPEAKPITCEYSEQPYLNKPIKWLCKIPYNESFKCTSYSYDTNGSLINANPKPVYIAGVGEINYFSSFPVGENPQLVNIEFDTAGMPSDIPIHLKVICKGDNERLVLVKVVTAQYKELTESVDFFMPIISNPAYYIGLFFLLLFLVIIFFVLLNILRNK